MDGEQAEISTEPGSEFSLWERSIGGKNLEFEENKKLYSDGILMGRKPNQLFL